MNAAEVATHVQKSMLGSIIFRLSALKKAQVAIGIAISIEMQFPVLGFEFCLLCFGFLVFWLEVFVWGLGFVIHVNLNIQRNYV